MRVILNDLGLFIGSNQCESVVITKHADDDYRYSMCNVKGYTIKKIIKSKYGPDKSILMKVKKNTHGTSFAYEGPRLKEATKIMDYTVCKHAKNNNGNYINYYEK